MTEGTSDARPDGGAGALLEAKEAVGAEAMYAADAREAEGEAEENEPARSNCALADRRTACCCC